MEVEALIRSASPPLSRGQGRLGGSSRGGGPLPLDTFPFDEALRDITAARPSSTLGAVPRPPDPIAYHGQQFLEIKMTERRGKGPALGPGEPEICGLREGERCRPLGAATNASTPTELERQMKMENLFVTWQQRSAPASMPISVSDPEM